MIQKVAIHYQFPKPVTENFEQNQRRGNMRQNHVRYLLFILFLSLVFVLANHAWAARTGKISGRVFEKDTKESLAGANIIIEGTTMGAATDSASPGRSTMICRASEASASRSRA